MDYIDRRSLWFDLKILLLDRAAKVFRAARESSDDDDAPARDAPSESGLARTAAVARRRLGALLRARRQGHGARSRRSCSRRLLDREDFGVAAYALTLMALFGPVPTLGSAPRSIYHADDERYANTGFWLGLAAALAGTAIVWLLAPLAEHLFGDPRAIAVHARACG
jgi:hypothetical protein